MAFMRSPVRSRSGPPSFAHDCGRRMPTVASHYFLATFSRRGGGLPLIGERATDGRPPFAFKLQNSPDRTAVQICISAMHLD